MTFPEFRDNRVIMVHLRFTSLLLGLLLSLVVAPRVPTVLANKEVTMADKDQALGSVKEIGDENKMVAATQSGRLKGRKIGVEDVPKKEARNEMNTGANLSCGHGEKRELSLECMLMSNRGLPSRVSLVGLIPFSSDYHAPKGHPPKEQLEQSPFSQSITSRF